MKNRIENAIILWIRQSGEFIKGLVKYWWGALFIVIFSLITFVYGAPPIFPKLSSTTYTHGILTCAMVAWCFGFWTFVMTKKEYEISQDRQQSPVKKTGNRNWVSVSFGLIAVLVFWLLGTPRLALIIIGVLQFFAFGIGYKYPQQAEYLLPRLCNTALVFLSVWILAA